MREIKEEIIIKKIKNIGRKKNEIKIKERRKKEDKRE
jgi:hypothetical protein